VERLPWNLGGPVQAPRQTGQLGGDLALWRRGNLSRIRVQSGSAASPEFSLSIKWAAFMQGPGRRGRQASRGRRASQVSWKLHYGQDLLRRLRLVWGAGLVSLGEIARGHGAGTASSALRVQPRPAGSLRTSAYADLLQMQRARSGRSTAAANASVNPALASSQRAKELWAGLAPFPSAVGLSL
jgi:hypothetical protein